MRNKFFLFLFSVSAFTPKVFADTTAVANDSAIKPFTPPNQGPLGIDNMTGLALYGVVIFFAVLVITLWRRNIINARTNNG